MLLLTAFLKSGWPVPKVFFVLFMNDKGRFIRYIYMNRKRRGLSLFCH